MDIAGVIGVSTRGVRAVVALAAVLLAVGPSESLAAEAFPTHIPLPNGFQPEGILVGPADTFYAGSRGNGAIYRGSLRTGRGAVLLAGAPGSATLGMTMDQANRIFAAGGQTGQARVVDGSSGAVIKTYQLAVGPTFVNDVAIVGDAAFFTDSLNAVLYRVPRDLGPAEVIPLTGDFQPQAGFNANGIDATADGTTLVFVQSSTGQLFTADPATGATRLIDLAGEAVPNGDGILLEGTTLAVVQNSMNLVAVIELSPDLSTGRVVGRIGNGDFDVPTTIDRYGSRYYVVNARFNAPPLPTTEYWVTGFSRT